MEQNCSSNIVCATIAAATQQLCLGCDNAGTLLNLESFLPGVSTVEHRSANTCDAPTVLRLCVHRLPPEHSFLPCLPWRVRQLTSLGCRIISLQTEAATLCLFLPWSASISTMACTGKSGVFDSLSPVHSSSSGYAPRVLNPRTLHNFSLTVHNIHTLNLNHT